MKQNIMIVTGDRSDFGLLTPIIKNFKSYNDVAVYLVATGTHVAASRGYNSVPDVKDIEPHTLYLETLLDTNSYFGMAKSMGLVMNSMSDLLKIVSPDLVLVLGDRFEAFAVAAAAYTCRVPVAHVRGGEVTSGSLDDGYRHAITKLSSLHFVATEEYRNRVIQLGEHPSSVFYVGDTTIIPDNILEQKEEKDPRIKRIFIVYHSVTKDEYYGMQELNNLLYVIEATYNTDNYKYYVNMSNADSGSYNINLALKDFVSKDIENRFFIEYLGHNNFIGMLNNVDVIVGNSSAALSIAPSLKVGIINIGERQKGRVRSESVVDCGGSVESIFNAFRYVFSDEYKVVRDTSINPYYAGESATDIICRTIIDWLSRGGNRVIKEFHDVKFQSS